VVWRAGAGLRAAGDTEAGLSRAARHSAAAGSARAVGGEGGGCAFKLNPHHGSVRNPYGPAHEAGAVRAGPPPPLPQGYARRQSEPMAAALSVYRGTMRCGWIETSVSVRERIRGWLRASHTWGPLRRPRRRMLLYFTPPSPDRIRRTRTHSFTRRSSLVNLTVACEAYGSEFIRSGSPTPAAMSLLRAYGQLTI